MLITLLFFIYKSKKSVKEYKEKKVLFILKKREDYGPKHHDHKSLSTGLYNSAKFVNEMLVENGVNSHMVVSMQTRSNLPSPNKYAGTNASG